jgi:hypothetical protein
VLRGNDKDAEAQVGNLYKRYAEWSGENGEKPVSYDDVRAAALHWFKADSYLVGSFLWVADHLGVDPEAVRRSMGGNGHIGTSLVIRTSLA